MAIRKCNKGHFFDDQKFSQCPVCKNANAALGNTATVPTDSVMFNYESDAKTEFINENYSEEQNTVALYALEEGINPVVGWLVCTSGGEKGKSFELHDGRNFIGRSMTMDIIIAADNYVSREKHCSVVYDNKNISFYVLGGNGTSFVNDRLVNVPCELKEGDSLAFGESAFVFIPYCKEGRTWNEK